MNRAGTGGKPRSPLLFVFLTVFIDLLGFGIVIPLLPVYSEMYRAGPAEIGLLMASFSAMQFVFAPFWGRLSDRIGRKPVLVGGLLGTAAAYVLFARADSLALLFASRLLAGFFGANVSTAQAYIADVTAPEDRAKGMGLIGAAFGLGFCLGPLLGGELTHISAAAPGWFAAGFSLAAALFGALTLVEPARARGRASRVFGLEELRGAAAQPRLGTLYVLSFAFVAAFACFESMFTVFGLARFPAVFGLTQPVDDASVEEILRAAPVTGRYLAGIGIVSAIIQGGLIRRLVPRFGETTLVVVGPALLGLGLLAIALAPSWGFVVAACLILPVGFGLNNPSLASLLSRAAPAAEQGGYLGLQQSVGSLARMAGPAAAGLVFQRFGPASPFVLGAALLGVSTLLAWRYHRRFGASFPRVARGAPPA
ncbi:MAG: MFS transporter [Planctomycetes bacterium]|nr:MFS transporter [Planctomycetota bacterium]